MTLYEKLGLVPNGQVTRCEVRDVVTTSTRDAARAFGLRETVDVPIDADTARTIIVNLLLEYADDWEGSLAQRQSRAKEATEILLASLDTSSARFFTNGSFENGRLTSWSSATASCLDTGVLILSERQIACLWIQNDD